MHFDLVTTTANRDLVTYTPDPASGTIGSDARAVQQCANMVVEEAVSKTSGLPAATASIAGCCFLAT